MIVFHHDPNPAWKEPRRHQRTGVEISSKRCSIACRLFILWLDIFQRCMMHLGLQLKNKYPDHGWRLHQSHLMFRLRLTERTNHTRAWLCWYFSNEQKRFHGRRVEWFAACTWGWSLNILVGSTTLSALGYRHDSTKSTPTPYKPPRPFRMRSIFPVVSFPRSLILSR